VSAGAPHKKYIFEWLKTGLFKPKDDSEAAAKEAEAAATKVVEYLGNHNEFKSHGARVGIPELRSAAFTLKVYGHLLPRRGRRGVDVLDDATIRNPRAIAQAVAAL
jgi:hypothetical protein